MLHYYIGCTRIYIQIYNLASRCSPHVIGVGLPRNAKFSRHCIIVSGGSQRLVLSFYPCEEMKTNDSFEWESNSQPSSLDYNRTVCRNNIMIMNIVRYNSSKLNVLINHKSKEKYIFFLILFISKFVNRFIFKYYHFMYYLLVILLYLHNVNKTFVVVYLYPRPLCWVILNMTNQIFTLFVARYGMYGRGGKGFRT